MTKPVILAIEHLTKHYPQSTTPALNQVSLSLTEGQILGLLGPSGCGKTTLLRLIAGFEHPDQGQIILAGQPIAGAGHWLPPELRDVGMVFQDYALFPHLNLLENVAFGLKNRQRSRRYSRPQVQTLVAEAIELVGLTGLEQRFPHELSGGQQQRAALARALAPQPSLILLDEPLSNLDVQVRLRLREELRDILKRIQSTTIFVTHDQEEALAMSDQVAVMRQGQLEQVGTPEQVYTHPQSRFVAEFVTQSNVLAAQRQGDGWQTEVGYFSSRCCAQIPQTVDNGPVDLMIRPEDLILEPDAEGQVIIRERHFLGREHRYCLLSPSGQELHAHQRASNPLDIGCRVNLAVADATLMVFQRDVADRSAAVSATPKVLQTASR
jgi:iron(III) transport system ATP-binding protein